MANPELELGFEVGTGAPVGIPINHMVATGTSQMAGKTTTLDALVSRLPSDFKAVAFITKRGEGSFEGGSHLNPFYKERADWRYVQSILEAAMQQKLKFETAWIIKSSRGARSLREVQKNVKTALEKAKGLSESVYTTLDAYLDIVIPQLDGKGLTDEFYLNKGLNVYDLTPFDTSMQGLIIASTIDAIHKREKKTITIIPEAWKFLPQGRKTPVLLSVEALVREGAALHNFVWMDSQDVTGVEKAALKQTEVWLLGRQREVNEIERSLVQIPLPRKVKPKPEEIAKLPKGTFFACFGDSVKRTYVWPAWLKEEDAKDVAIGAIFMPEPPAPPPERKYEIAFEEEEDMGEKEQERIKELEEQLAEARNEIDELRTRFDKIPVAKKADVPAESNDGKTYHVKVASKIPKLDIEEKIVQVQATSDDKEGRLALIISRGFFDQPRMTGTPSEEFEESVSSRDTRPKKEEILRRLRLGTLGGVVFVSLSRWGRSLSELSADMKEAVDRGWGLVSIKEGLRFDTAAGKMYAGILAVFAEFERDLVRERTLAGLARAKAQGRKLGARYGNQNARKQTPPENPPIISQPQRVTQAIMAKANGGQQQIAPGYVSDPHSDKARPEHGYWLIPPEVWDPLNKEFGFDYDPCPNPRPEGYDGLEADWGRSNWVNPPFWAGITGWVRKALKEREKGKDVVLIVPLDNWVHLLLEAGAEVRPVGSHDWIHTRSGKRQKAPRPSVLFVLRGRNA